MDALECRIEYILVVPLQPHFAVCIVMSVAHLAFAHVDISVVPRQFVGAIDVVVEFYVGSGAHLAHGIIPVECAVERLSGLVLDVTLTAAVGALEAAGNHYAQFVAEEAVAIGHAGGQVGQWCPLGDVQRGFVKVFGPHDAPELRRPEAFVGGFLVDCSPVE